MGPFELTLLALLPHAPEAELLAAILGFRIVYRALPAILGAAWLARRDGPAAAPDPAALTASALTAARRAEAGLVRQGDLGLLAASGGTPIGGVTGQALVPVAEEAWIAPAAFRPDTPARRGFRRKLRAATARGVQGTRPDAPLPPSPRWPTPPPASLASPSPPCRRRDAAPRGPTRRPAGRGRWPAPVQGGLRPPVGDALRRRPRSAGARPRALGRGLAHPPAGASPASAHAGGSRSS